MTDLRPVSGISRLHVDSGGLGSFAESELPPVEILQPSTGKPPQKKNNRSSSRSCNTPNGRINGESSTNNDCIKIFDDATTTASADAISRKISAEHSTIPPRNDSNRLTRCLGQFRKIAWLVLIVYGLVVLTSLLVLSLRMTQMYQARIVRFNPGTPPKRLVPSVQLPPCPVPTGQPAFSVTPEFWWVSTKCAKGRKGAKIVYKAILPAVINQNASYFYDTFAIVNTPYQEKAADWPLVVVGQIPTAAKPEDSVLVMWVDEAGKWYPDAIYTDKDVIRPKQTYTIEVALADPGFDIAVSSPSHLRGIKVKRYRPDLLQEVKYVQYGRMAQSEEGRFALDTVPLYLKVFDSCGNLLTGCDSTT